MGVILKKNFRKCILFVTSLIIMFSSVCTVYADRSDVDAIVYVAKGQIALTSVCSQANKVAGSEILVYTSNDGLLSFSNSKYSELTTNIKKDFMETALVGVKKSGLGSKVKNKAYNFIADQDSTITSAMKLLSNDATADFATAAAWFKPFGSVVGVVLGILSLFIFMLLGLSIVVDCAYMVLPVFRLALDGDNGKPPKFISREAYSSVIESENSGTHYKGYMGMYLRRRTGSMIIMSICLGYLISGQIYALIAYLIDAFSAVSIW